MEPLMLTDRGRQPRVSQLPKSYRPWHPRCVGRNLFLVLPLPVRPHRDLRRGLVALLSCVADARRHKVAGYAGILDCVR